MHRLKSLINTILGVFLFSILIAGCKGKPKTPLKPKADPPVVVDVIIATPQPITNIVEVNGTVIANESVELHPEVTGRLTYLHVPEGAHVNQGEILARINDADLRAQLEKSKVQLDLAQKTVARLQKLLDAGGVNQSDYDAAVNTASGLKADIDYTSALIEKTVLKAPFSGVIGLKQVSPGAFVTTASVIATLQQLDRIKIDFTLPEEYGSLIKKGDTVSIEADAATQARKKAVVIALEPQIDQNTRNIKVRAIMESGNSNPGTFVKVSVVASMNKNAVKVPTNALIPDDKNNQVILVKNGRAEFVGVQTGVRESNNVEITKGVNIGDTVVITGVLFARPKGILKVRSVKKLEQLSKQQ